jgi:DNA-binding response OmpR family regulator
MKKILIVEDEKVLADTLKEEFENAGFEVYTASDGEEGLAVMRSKPERPDLVLLDLLMPRMNGFTFLEEVSKDIKNNLKAIPVIVLSNLGQDEDLKRALTLGAIDYYVKVQHPISEVIEKVKQHLEKEPSPKV